MRPIAPILTIAMVTASLSGCHLIEALRPDGADQLPIGGTCATYQVVATDAQPVTPEILEQTRTIVESRVNAAGVAEPVVESQGEDRISVELPGVEAEANIRSLLGATGVVAFMPVPIELQGSVTVGPLPEGMLDTEPLFTGVEIASASIAQDQVPVEIVVNLELKDTASRLFDEYAADHYGEQFAIVLDNEVLSAPMIQATSFGGQVQISGGFTTDETYNLVTFLKFGSLPLEMREVDFGACEGAGSS